MSLQSLPVGHASSRPQASYTFAAFMSYSHAADNRFAPALQAALHRFAKPWYRLRAIRVFRDASTLSTTPGLWSAIRSALAGSRYFVLLASPDAAASHWVAREVAFWCGEHGSDSLLIVLTDGEMHWDEASGDFDWERTTALPPLLRGAFREEPRHVDFRALAHDPDRLTLRDQEFRDRVADLAATLHDRPKDELLGEDVRQHAVTRRWIGTAVALLITLLIIAVVMAIFALVQRNEARDQARTATSRLFAAQAVAEDRVDRALLLSLAAWRLEAGPEARGALAEVLARDSRAVRVLQGRGRVDSVAFSPDGLRLAATGRDGTVSLWEMRESGAARVAVVQMGEAPLRCLAWSHDGGTIAVGGNDGRVRLLDVPTQEPRGRPLDVSTSAVLAVTFDDDGRRLLTGAENGQARLWDVRTGSMVADAVGGHQGAVTSVAISPDGGPIATGGADWTVRLWDPDTLASVGAPLKGHVNWVSSLAFSPQDPSTLISTGHDSSIVVWNVRTGQRVDAPISSGSGRLRDVAFSADGSRLYSASEDRTVREWDVSARRQHGPPLGRVGGPVLSVAIRPQGDLVASGGDDGTVVLWSAAVPTSPLALPLLGGASGVTSAVFVADGRHLATARPDGTVVIWDLDSRRPLGPSLVPVDPRRRPLLATDARGRLLAVSGPGGVDLWDVEGRTRIRSIATESGPTALALSGDGRRLAVATAVPEPGSRVQIWDTGTGESAGPELTANRRAVNALAYSPDDTRLAAATHDSAVVVWDVSTGARLPLQQGRQAGQVTGVTFVSDDLVASGADDGSIVLTDTATGRPVGRRMEGHDGRIRAVTSAPQPGMVISGGEDGRVVLWDIHSQSRLGRSVAAFDGMVNDVEASPDGRSLVSAGPGGTVLTSTDVDVWLTEACRVAGRDLSAEEWRFYAGSAFEQEQVCASSPTGDDE